MTHDFAQRVISALRATNDIIEVDNKLHLRPGAVIGAPPPLLGPPGAPLHAWLALSLHGSSRALNRVSACVPACLRARAEARVLPFVCVVAGAVPPLQSSAPGNSGAGAHEHKSTAPEDTQTHACVARSGRCRRCPLPRTRQPPRALRRTKCRRA